MDSHSAALIGAGLAALGTGIAAIGVGTVFGHYLNGVARNPEADKALFSKAMIGTAMAEALGLMALVVAFMLIFSK